MAEEKQQGQTKGQDINQLLKVRREKLTELQNSKSKILTLHPTLIFV